MVSPKLLDELREIIKRHYGVALSKAEVSRIGNNLVDLFELLARINNRPSHPLQP